MKCWYTILLLGIASLQAQNVVLLRQIAENEKLVDSKRYDAFADLAEYYIGYDADSVSYFYQQYYELAIATQNPTEIRQAILNLGQAKLDNAEFEAAEDSFRRVIRLSQRIKPDEMMATAYEGLAGVFLDQGYYDSALVNYRRSEAIAREVGATRQLGVTLANLGFLYRGFGEPDSALTYLEEAKDVFIQLKDTIRIAWALFTIGEIVGIDDPEKAIAFFEESIAFYKALGQEGSIAYVLDGMGDLYALTGELKTSLDYYQRSLRISEEMGKKRQIMQVSDDIAVLLANQGEWEESQLYLEKALVIAQELNDREKLSSLLGSKATYYYNFGNDSLALEYGLEALAMARSIGSKYGKGDILNVLGNVYEIREEFDKAKAVFEEFYALGEELDFSWYQITSLIGLSTISRHQGKLHQSISYGERALSLSQENQLLSLTKDAADQLWKSQQALGLHADALSTYQLYIQSRDSLEREENQRAILEFEYSQQALQDSLAFVEQQAQTELVYERALARRNYLLLGGMAFALIAGLGIYFFQQRRLKEKEIGHQKELLGSTILTQENERQRIAKDLHDSVGSKLNVMNLFLHQLGRRNAEGKEEIQDMISVIDDTLQTTRRISHDLLPPTLEKFGLAIAIEELQEQLAQTEAPDLQVYSEGVRPDNIAPMIELNLFRILQELLNNTLKYAEADTIDIRLIQSEEKLILHYRDDGKGFDPSDSKSQKGLGMQNIQSRLQMMRGKMDLQSTPGQGVRVQLEVINEGGIGE